MQTIFNDGQEIVFGDLNAITSAVQKDAFERVAFELMGRQENVLFSDGFLTSYLTGTTVNVAAGIGFQTDSSQVDPESKKRLLFNAAGVTKTVTAPHATLDRIDLVCIKANLATALTESRRFKDVSGNVTTISLVTRKDWQADIILVDGTASGSPSAPAVPSGYIAIAKLRIHAVSGLSGSSDVTDLRPIYQPKQAPFATKVANYTLQKTDDTIFGSAAGGAIAITLPLASDVPGKEFRVKKVDSSANAVTVAASGSDLIDGEATEVLSSQYTTITVKSDGTGWNLL